MRLRAIVRKVTGNAVHRRGSIIAGNVVPGEDLPNPTWVEIVPEGEAFYLFRYTAEGQFITDTWHETLESAKEQAKFEYEIAEGDWTERAEARAEVVAEARRHWEMGRLIDAGRVLYEFMHQGERPQWAGRILEATGKLAHRFPEVRAVIQLTKDASGWGKAHDAFRAVRQRTLVSHGLDEAVLCLAENVAKVTYNCSSPRPTAPFDMNCGWWIPSCFQSVVKLANEEVLSCDAWTLVSEV